MRLEPTELTDVGIIRPLSATDTRGTFERTYSHREFADLGLAFLPVESTLSTNTSRGTVRGLHFQEPPQAKLVRCLTGAVYDVAVDVREGSPTFAEWVGVQISAANGLALFIPAGFAHGFQTLEDDTNLHYLISDFYAPDGQRGIRWDDPDLGIEWPIADGCVLSERDLGLPGLADLATS